ncbi:MAG: OmpA family protein [Alphaproteobacteria bacterium]
MGMRWLLGVVILAIVSLILAWFNFSPLSAPAQSQRMGASIEQALKTAGFDTVSVEMKGNVAHLSGTALTDSLVKDAATLAKGVHCETCKNPDPIWHEVDSQVKLVVAQAPVIKPVSPFTFSATKSADGSVLLDGYVSDENELNRVLREANALFPGMVKNDKLIIAAGAPNDSWGDVISEYLKALLNLDSGSVTLDDAQSLITGITTNEQVRSDIYATAFPAGYNAAANITVPNAQVVVSGNITSERSCQTLFNQLKTGKKIEFASGSEKIKPVSAPLLVALANAANQCETFNLSIDGYTDNDAFVGSDGQDLNKPLSQNRADSVRDYLVSSGVDTARLKSTGHGATNFIATNETYDGKAANRRIEFTVKTSN